MSIRLRLGILFSLLFATTAQADVRLPAIFSNHLVLQNKVPVPVWGWADPGENVTVELLGQSVTTEADAQGKWSLKLAPLPVAEGLTLTVRGQNTLRIEDVLVGEVWLASGQSNMAMTVQRARDFEQEKSAASFRAIRMFTVTSGAATQPQADCQGKWSVCDPETVGQFSATAYFFARELFRELQVPVGIIHSSVGGTAIESWTGKEIQADRPELRPIFAPWDLAAASWNPEAAQFRFEKALAEWKVAMARAKSDGGRAPRRPVAPVPPRQDRNHPANLFNGKIAPLIPYAIRGAIWYQGEHNTNPRIAHLYGQQLELLIGDWRQRWGQGDFPFAWVQLPNFDAPQRSWPVVREQMLKTLSVPNTGMAITIDIGDPKDIHPANKQDVGRRLATWALVDVYATSKSRSASMGPIPKTHRFDGNRCVIEFAHVRDHLVVHGEGELTGFTLAGDDRVFYPATARIENQNQVAVVSEKVSKPVAVRYAWSDNPHCNLWNESGLPASPFRTDDWELPRPTQARDRVGATARRQPNIVLILFDDLGYGDLGCYGAKGFSTPHIDRLASEGTRFTSFYVSQAVCSASRASLLTGCYANRVGLEGALNHTSQNGIGDQEVLLSEICKQRGYATAIFGKWHLGMQDRFHPLHHGFDAYYGLPYSNDNSKFHPIIRDMPPLPMHEGLSVAEVDPDQSQFTRKFTERAVEFIEQNQNRPFFLYLPHVMPHVPIFPSKEFQGRSQRGRYGDVVEELDWSVGQILRTLEQFGIADNTWVIVSSDNGPFLSYGDHAGSAGRLREGKLTTFEGGIRVPCIMRWPERIPANRVCPEMLATIDLVPTIAKLVGGKLPSHPIDGRDAWPLISGASGAKSPHEALVFYNGLELQAIRSGPWKLHFPHPYMTVDGTPGKDGKPANFGKLQPKSISQSGIAGIASRHGYRVQETQLELYHLDDDVEERRDVAREHPDVVRRLSDLAEQARNELGDSLTQRAGSGIRVPAVAP